MKPRNKFEERVVLLHKELPSLSKTKQEWIKNNFTKYAYITKTHYTCLECTHKWPVKNNPMIMNRAVCPECGNRLMKLADRARTDKYIQYFKFIFKFKEFQVIRVYFVTRQLKAGKKPFFDFKEVYSHWINSAGKHAIMARGVNPMSNMYYDMWAENDNQSIKNTNHERYYFHSLVFSKKSYIKEIKRNGFKGHLHGHNYEDFFLMLLQEPKFEILLKNNQHPLVGKFDFFRRDIFRYWDSIRICMRHKYIIGDPVMWIDHMEVLEYFERDLRNPKNICPANLSEEHQVLVSARNKIENLEEREARRLEAEEYEEEYKERRSKYFGLEFKGEEISIVPLKEVVDILEEGYIHDHCVFTNGYHKKEDSLLFSARLGDIRLETIDFALSAMRVTQCYGYNNKPSEYHDEILSIMNKNIPKIMEVHINV